jgi:hypothetical protein
LFSTTSCLTQAEKRENTLPPAKQTQVTLAIKEWLRVIESRLSELTIPLSMKIVPLSTFRGQFHTARQMKKYTPEDVKHPRNHGRLARFSVYLKQKAKHSARTPQCAT